MTDLGELPAEAARAIEKELGTSVTVAFLHERAHVFYCDLWTWNGRHVLGSDDNYSELDPDQWQEMIGSNPTAKYGKPILYRIPWVPALLVAVGVLYVVRKRFFKSEQEKLEALLKDPRYERALEEIFGEENDEESDLVITSLDERKFLDAKNLLISEGVDAVTAETNLRKVAEAIVAVTNSQIDEVLALASELDQAEEWDESAEAYSDVISSLPDTDDRKQHARNCLESVNEKRAANPPKAK